MEANSQTSISPVLPSQRFQIIDILRGFAIFGILLVNMEFFNNSLYLGKVHSGTCRHVHVEKVRIEYSVDK